MQKKKFPRFFSKVDICDFFFLCPLMVPGKSFPSTILICFSIRKLWKVLVSLVEEQHLPSFVLVPAKDMSVKHAIDMEVNRNFSALARSKWFRGGFSFNVLHITLNHTHFNFFGPFPSLISSVFGLTVTDSNIASISPPLQTGILSQVWRKAWRLFWKASLFKNNGAPVWNRKACV